MGMPVCLFFSVTLKDLLSGSLKPYCSCAAEDGTADTASHKKMAICSINDGIRIKDGYADLADLYAAHEVHLP